MDATAPVAREVESIKFEGGAARVHMKFSQLEVRLHPRFDTWWQIAQSCLILSREDGFSFSVPLNLVYFGFMLKAPWDRLEAVGSLRVALPWRITECRVETRLRERATDEDYAEEPAPDYWAYEEEFFDRCGGGAWGQVELPRGWAPIAQRYAEQVVRATMRLALSASSEAETTAAWAATEAAVQVAVDAWAAVRAVAGF